MGKRLVPAPTAVKAPIVIPRGHDHYWTVIRALDRLGEWSGGEVVEHTNAHRSSIHDFVRRLVA
ncbi:hypothetical protein ABTU92_29495, partial [Rhodoplanes sp. SY1]